MFTENSPTRRRFLGISAAAGGLAILPVHGWAKADARMVEWQGVALGARVSLRIHHHDTAAATEALGQVQQELRRLEAIFSLYREDSALRQLNRQGALVAPPRDLVDLLRVSQEFAGLTGGAFDPTIQPLWQLYSSHFSQPHADPLGPPQDRIAAALQLVGLESVLVDRNRIAFRHRGMSISLNGIAQGYITDRAVEILRRYGIGHTLVDMGESRALGHHPCGRPWQAMIADSLRPGSDGPIVPLVDMSLATSGGYGTQFDRAGHFHHIFDPHSGRSPQRYRSVSVMMPTATAADALSTAFTLMTPQKIEAVLNRLGAGRAFLIDPDGQHRTIQS